MKKRLLAALLACSIPLCGCASMLERDYVSVTTHSSTKADVGSPSVLRVESYQELVNSLIYFISTYSPSGTVRLYMDSAMVEEHLHNARLEILQEYPLAVYAVDNISFKTNPLVTYTETEVTFSYRRTQQQVTSIVSANGVTAARSALSAALAEFADSCVLDTNYFDQKEEYILDLIQQAYYDAPATALEYPSAEINIYPNTGRQRIVEVLFHYESDPARLMERAVLLQQACSRLAMELTASDLPSDTALNTALSILDSGGYSPTAGSSAYDALLGSGANAEGLSLAMAAVCGELDIGCKVARGLLDGEPHFWNVVETEDGWRHMDLSHLDPQSPFHTDEQWLDGGYLWRETALPACE